jgi:hypothetical protein
VVAAIKESTGNLWRACPLGFASLIATLILLCGHANAAESATSVYLLGFRSTAAGVVPPPGVYTASDKYFYSGEAAASRDFQFGGQLVAEVEANVFIDALTATWIIPQKVLGGHFGVAATLPIGWAEVKAGATLATPGGALSAGRTDDLTGLGDMFFTALLGWHRDVWHWNVNVGLNAPTGSWSKGRIANLGFNRWALDTGVAVTYLDQKTGHELTIAPGVTFNGENDDTDYKTGTEFHLEFSALQHFSQTFALGVTGYHYQQLTGDSGSGARLGDFKGRVTGIGPVVNYTFLVGKTPVNTNLRWIHEFNVKNRLKGDVGFLTVAIPLGSP